MTERRTISMEDGVIHQRVTHDIEHIVENNLVHKVAGNNGFGPTRNFRKIGSIPMHLLNEAFKKGINPLDGSPEGQKWIKKYLQENKKFMTVDTIKTNRKHIVK
jgi:hypothetical protein